MADDDRYGGDGVAAEAKVAWESHDEMRCCEGSSGCCMASASMAGMRLWTASSGCCMASASIEVRRLGNAAAVGCAAQESQAKEVGWGAVRGDSVAC